MDIWLPKELYQWQRQALQRLQDGDNAWLLGTSTRREFRVWGWIDDDGQLTERGKQVCQAYEIEPRSVEKRGVQDG